MKSHILAKIGLVGLALALAAAAGIIFPAGQARAQEATLRLMIGTFERLDREDILKSFLRLPIGSCLVEVTGGPVQTYLIEDGLLTFNLPIPSEAVLTVAGTQDPDALPPFRGRRFRVSFDAFGTFTAEDLDEPDGPGRALPLGVGMLPDGSYHFEFLKDNMFFFSPAEPGGPILGVTYNWELDNYEPCPGTSRWSPAAESIVRLFRSWSYSSLDGRSPSLVTTMIHPDGANTTRTYVPPEVLGETLFAVDQDSNHWSSVQPVDGHGGISGLTWKWRIDYTPEFTKALAPGTHAMVYELITPEGVLSNRRVEFFVVPPGLFD